MIPDVMIQQELQTGMLVNLMPGKSVKRTLYWHRWTLESGVLAQISQQCIEHARRVLAQ